MDIPEFPLRWFTKDSEPEPPQRSINYYGGNTKLMNALQNALCEDEWDELRHSKLGVFVKFHELKFEWASRIVYYLHALQLECKKKYELWCLIGAQPIRFSLNEFKHLTDLECKYVEHVDKPLETEQTDEMIAFWELLRVPLRVGPTPADLFEACKLCGTWSRENRMRLGFLCIYASFIEGVRASTNISYRFASMVMNLAEFENYPWGRVCFKNLMDNIRSNSVFKANTLEGFAQILQIWLYVALPEFGSTYGEPLPGDPTPPMLAFKGSKLRKNIKDNILKQVKVNNFTYLGFEEMFPVWDDDIEDVKVDNIIKAMFNKFNNSGSWTWKRSHWKTEGVMSSESPPAEQLEEKREVRKCR